MGLIPSTHGRGYATEAIRALIKWAEVNFLTKPITCIIDPKNDPSLRVASKLGFRESARAIYHGEEIILLSRQKPQPA